ncbi:prepilin-type N-terminal cleavage/methylation domain-containing protein [Aeromonas simiae]|uniref:prepilin-type N-terminal cleavage/methylation domain-containing protein n=1 Tax=Aeromonas simiae TaxID=218936 RepID=UPI0005A8B310|nr:prepilin-type N-terminal cleavage/methylation domain-containing protein [Aeromonas simiae]
MKKQSGFTLIELVIVIIILGILAVTAAPKFLNLQDDARTATLKGVEGSLNSAAAMVYSKAVIAGQEKNVDGSVKLADSTVATVYGYPKADAQELQKVVSLSDKDWTFGADGDAVGIFPNGVSAATAIKDKNCYVSYAEPASSGTAPEVTVFECK